MCQNLALADLYVPAHIGQCPLDIGGGRAEIEEVRGEGTSPLKQIAQDDRGAGWQGWHRRDIDLSQLSPNRAGGWEPEATSSEEAAKRNAVAAPLVGRSLALTMGAGWKAWERRAVAGQGWDEERTTSKVWQLSPKSHGQNLALTALSVPHSTVLYVPCSLDSGGGQCRDRMRVNSQASTVERKWHT